MDNPQVTDLEIAWLAGIWDGEGTISVRKNIRIKQYSPRVSMVNTNAAMLSKVAQILEGLGIKFHLREKGQGGFDGSSKQCWIISVEHLTGAQNLVSTMMPYLTAKKPQGELLLRFVKNSSSLYGTEAGGNGYAPYNEDELRTLELIYVVNGNQRGTSETIREGAKISA